MKHETLPLFNTKMLKAKLVAKLMNSNFTHNAGGKPPTINHYISNVLFF
jgi:hypothetical protein